MTSSMARLRPEPAAWDGLEEMREGLRSFLSRHCADENDVEDAIQETFLRAARYRRAHHVRNLRPWALRIALNVLADARRRGVRTQAGAASVDVDDVPQREDQLVPTAFRVGEHCVDGEAARELLLLTLGAMRAGDRALLDSYYAGDERTAAVAEACRLPRRVVKVRLYRARQRLARALRRRVALVAVERRWAS